VCGISRKGTARACQQPAEGEVDTAGLRIVRLPARHAISGVVDKGIPINRLRSTPKHIICLVHDRGSVTKPSMNSFHFVSSSGTIIGIVMVAFTLRLFACLTYEDLSRIKRPWIYLVPPIPPLGVDYLSAMTLRVEEK